MELLFNENLISQKDLQSYFDLKIEMKPVKTKEPKLEYAEEILNPKKDKKGKDKKKKKKKNDD